MNLKDFINLPVDEKAFAVFKGAYIDSREEANMVISLFQLDGFYVEVYYTVQGNEIKSLIPFTSGDLLKPYLEKIDLTEIEKILE